MTHVGIEPETLAHAAQNITQLQKCIMEVAEADVPYGSTDTRQLGNAENEITRNNAN